MLRRWIAFAAMVAVLSVASGCQRTPRQMYRDTSLAYQSTLNVLLEYKRAGLMDRQTAEKLADGAEVAQAALDAWGNALANDLPPAEAIASFTRAWTQLYLVRQQIERGKEANDAEH